MVLTVYRGFLILMVHTTDHGAVVTPVYDRSLNGFDIFRKESVTHKSN